MDIFGEVFERERQEQSNGDCRNVDEKILPRMYCLMRSMNIEHRG